MEFKTEISANGVMTLTVGEKNTYIDAAVEAGLTEETISDVCKFNSKYVADVTTAVTEKAKKEMLGNKEINQVVAQLPYLTSSKSNVEVIVDRSKTFPGMQGRPDTTKSKIKVAVKDSFAKFSGKSFTDLEADLTAALLK